MIAHPDNLDTALSAARAAGLSADQIILFDKSSSRHGPSGHVTLNELIDQGLRLGPTFVERRLRPGEAKTKLAFLSFSSGTTGKPKVCLS